VAALITFLGMLGLTRGTLINAWVAALDRWLGWFAPVVPLTMLVGAVAFGRRRLGIPWQIPWVRVVALEISFFALMGVLALAADYSLAESESGKGGGLIGWGVGSLVGGVLGRWGGLAVLVAILGGAVILAVRQGGWSLPSVRRRGDEQEWLPEAEPLAALTSPAVAERAEKPASPPPKAATTRARPAAPARAASRPRGERDRRLPPSDLLDRIEARRVTGREIQQMANAIERTLADFGIPARVVRKRGEPRQA